MHTKKHRSILRGLLLDVLGVLWLVLVDYAGDGLSVLVFVAGALAVSAFFFNNELLSRVGVDL